MNRVSRYVSWAAEMAVGPYVELFSKARLHSSPTEEAFSGGSSQPFLKQYCSPQFPDTSLLGIAGSWETSSRGGYTEWPHAVTNQCFIWTKLPAHSDQVGGASCEINNVRSDDRGDSRTVSDWVQRIYCGTWTCHIKARSSSSSKARVGHDQ